MKAVITILVLLVIGMVAVGLVQGWIQFSSSENKTTIELDQGEMRESARQAGQEGERLLRETGESLKRAGQEIEESVETEPVDEPVDEQEPSSLSS